MADVTAAWNDAAGYLMDAANKDGLIDGDIVHAVNTLLDGKSTDFSDSDPAIHDAEDGVAEIINPTP